MTPESFGLADQAKENLSDQDEQLALEIFENILETLGRLKQQVITGQESLDLCNRSQRVFHKWLRIYSQFEIALMQGNVQVNKSNLSMAAQEEDFVKALVFLLTERNIHTLEVQAGVRPGELLTFYQYLNEPAEELAGQKNMNRALKRVGIKRINVVTEQTVDPILARATAANSVKLLEEADASALHEKAGALANLDIETMQKAGNLVSTVVQLFGIGEKTAGDRLLKRLLSGLSDSSNSIRLGSARQLGKISEKSIEFQQVDLFDRVVNALSQRVSLESNESILAAISAALERATQVNILREENYKAERLLDSLQSLSERIGDVHGDCIGRVANATVIRSLIHQLESGDRAVQNQAENLLSRLGKNVAPYMVDQIYSTEDIRVRETVSRILIKIGSEALPEIYQEMLEDMDDAFRVAMIRVIGEVGDEVGIKHLLPYVGDPDERVAKYTQRALLRIGGDVAENPVIEELGRHRYSDEFFKEMLKDIAKNENRTFVAPLIGVLENVGPFAAYVGSDNKVQVVEALSKLGGSDVVEAVGKLLTKRAGLFGLGRRDEALETAACGALRRMGDPAATKALKKAAKSRMARVRAAAERALKVLAEVKESPWKEKENEASEKQEPSRTQAVAPAPVQSIAPPTEEVDEALVDSFSPDLPKPKAEPMAVETESVGVELDENPIEMETVDIESGGDEDTSFDFDQLDDELPVVEFDLPAQDEISTGAADFNDDLDPDGVHIILSVGGHIIDGVQISIPEIHDEGKLTKDQRGALFALAPGSYDIVIRDQGMEVTKQIEVTGMETEIFIDLQDIFNF